MRVSQSNLLSGRRETSKPNRKQRRAQAKAVTAQPLISLHKITSLLEIGLRHHQSGRLAEAKASYSQALTLEPGHAEALHLLGLIAHQVGQNDVSVETIIKAIRRAPKVALYRCSLANALKALGRLDEASRAYAQAIQLEPDFAEAHYNLAIVLRAMGRIDDAIRACETAVVLKPELAEAHDILGAMLLARGRRDEACAAFRRAIRAKPDAAEIHANLGIALQEAGRPDEALAAYDTAIRINPDYAEAHTNRGNVCKALGRLDDAASAHRMAIWIKPDCAEARFNLGNTLKALGRSDEAIDAYEEAIHVRPDFAEARFNHSMELLLAGDFDRGWAEYEWRLDEACQHLAPRTFSRPRWRGENLRGRRILLHAEQGLGDTIQFCRYASLVAARGGCVTLEVPKLLVGLLSGLAGVTQLIAAGSALPAFDVHCPLMSLPLVFGTRLATIPAPIPYLTAKPDRVVRWRNRLGPSTRLRVGLVWSGGLRPDQPELREVNERRNIPLRMLGRLNHPGIDFVSLQKGEPAESEGLALKDIIWPAGNFYNAAPQIGDFEDTAALIETLDLVISVDTSTAHLAAAMGKPVWLLNRFDSCWRWLEHRDDSPWYPTLRLFRQTAAGDWPGVMERVAGALADHLQAGR